MDLKIFCKTGLALAEHGIIEGTLSGNIVKREHWRGESCAYRAVLAAIHDNEVAAIQSGEAWINPATLQATARAPDCRVAAGSESQTGNTSQSETASPLVFGKGTRLCNKCGKIQAVCTCSEPG